MKIKLSNGKYALIDEQDYNLIAGKRWHYTNGYANQTWTGGAMTMHKLIMNTPKGFETDHINGNRLDNRRSNLRIVTSAQNKWNMGKSPKNTSGYKGVTWNKVQERWYTRIRVNGKRIELGYYNDLQQAAEAYKTAELKYRGEFAR